MIETKFVSFASIHRFALPPSRLVITRMTRIYANDANGCMIFKQVHAQKNLPAEKKEKKKKPRFFEAKENGRRASGFKTPHEKGEEKDFSLNYRMAFFVIKKVLSQPRTLRVIVGKNVAKKAVARNLLKSRIKTIVRPILTKSKAGFVIIVKSGAADLTFTELRKEVIRAVK